MSRDEQSVPRRRRPWSYWTLAAILLPLFVIAHCWIQAKAYHIPPDDGCLTDQERREWELFKAILWTADGSPGGDQAKVEQLIGEGVSPNARQEDGRTPLHMAAEHNNTAVMKFLLDHGAKVNAVDAEGQTPLHLAASNLSANGIAQLIRHGAKIDVADQRGATPLAGLLGCRYASPSDTKMQLRVARLLIHAGADVNVNNGHILFEAVGYHPDFVIAAFLLENGVKIDQVSRSGYTPLMEAIQFNYFSAIEFLLEHGANANAVEPRTGDTPLHLALRYGNADQIKTIMLLIAHGADINRPNAGENTPLAFARSLKNPAILAAMGQGGRR